MFVHGSKCKMKITSALVIVAISKNIILLPGENAPIVNATIVPARPEPLREVTIQCDAERRPMIDQEFRPTTILVLLGDDILANCTVADVSNVNNTQNQCNFTIFTFFPSTVRNVRCAGLNIAGRCSVATENILLTTESKFVIFLRFQANL